LGDVEGCTQIFTKKFNVQPAAICDELLSEIKAINGDSANRLTAIQTQEQNVEQARTAFLNQVDSS
jgi:hypothetical protein